MIVGVIGSGAIGPDLAYAFLTALAKGPETRVLLVDVKRDALDAGVARIHEYIEKGVARGKLEASVAKAIDRALTPTRSLADLATCDYVLEAATEDLTIKRGILANLEAVVRPDCLIGFATSGIPRAQIVANAAHPERCFVNHPFYPAWRTLPMEIVSSGDAALGARMVSTITRLGKVPILTADVECFAADDVFCNYVSEAARLVERGIATPAQVDAIVNDAIGGGGPFKVMDLTRGNLLVHKCQLLMQRAATGTHWFAPPPILEKQGSTPWHDHKALQNASYDARTRDRVLDCILAVLFSRSYFVVEHGVAAPTEANWLMRAALGFRKGTLELAEELGGAKVRDLCERFAAENPGFFVPKAAKEGKLPPFRRTLLVERDETIGIIRVFRPEVRNAVSKETLLEIVAAVDELDQDASIQGIVLTSFDGSFAGADIHELALLPNAESCREFCVTAHRILERIGRASKPVVSATDGPVLGGGAELAMACHARVVGKALMLGQPETNLGIIPGYGGTQRLPRLIGVARALDLIRTGRLIDAVQAAEWGWASIEPVDDVIAAAKQLIGEHLANQVTLAPIATAPIALPEKFPSVDIGHRSLTIDAIAVDVIRRGAALPLAQGLQIEADGFARCKATVDMDIGMKNLLQNGPRVAAAFLNE